MKESTQFSTCLFFFRKLNALVLSYAIKQIKYKLQVGVDRSWKLMGVMDEYRYLKTCVCVKDDESGSVECLKGDTLVTRSPALHCGDLQRVYTVGSIDFSHPLSSLYNCIVFSSQGSRPVPSQLSGSDLDGDLFDVSQNPSLFHQLGMHLILMSLSILKTLDANALWITFPSSFSISMLTIIWGKLCSRHALIADQSLNGVRREDCVKLSRLASIAVDFPKTGKPVNMWNARRISSRISWLSSRCRNKILSLDHCRESRLYHKTTMAWDQTVRITT